MKSFAIKTSFGLLALSFLVLFCIGLGYTETPVPEGHLRIVVINDTDVLMCQNTYWVNHNVPDIYWPNTVCGGEIQPGKSMTFDRNMSSWDFVGTSIYRTEWYACRDHYNELEEYRNEVISIIPEDTAIIKIYHDHFEIIPIHEWRSL